MSLCLCGYLVSILVLMESFLQSLKNNGITDGNPVSILVLMESFLQSILNILFTVSSACFNPCFNGILSSIYGTGNLNVKISGVSILVLMESFLQFMASIISLFVSLCFNPCFNGILSSMVKTIEDVADNSKFQSLF